MIKVAVTGAEGFVGSHLLNYLHLFPDEFELTSIGEDVFNSPSSLKNALEGQDAVVHLAALNRHSEQGKVLRVNREITNSLLDAMEQLPQKPHIIFSSSNQEGNGTGYGKVKEESRVRLADWAKANGSPFLGMIIPNVFGPFGKPYYHSVVATFCHQLVGGEKPEVMNDKELQLIYVHSLCTEICQSLKEKRNEKAYRVKEDGKLSVSILLSKLKSYDDEYRVHFRIPMLNNAFEVALFNTYRTFIPVSDFPFKLKLHTDNRGALAEVIRSGTKGQVFFSTTKPGITRGNHFHLRKIERFCVIRGKASIKLRKIGTSEVINIQVNGEEPSVVDMPVWYTHSISNTGDDELITLFWSNEFFDPGDADTWYEEV